MDPERVGDRGLGAVEGRVALVAMGDPDAPTHHLKRVVRDGREYRLRSDNPDVAALDGAGATPIALCVGTVRPEDLAPPVGTALSDVAEAFGLSAEPTGTWCRVDGHLFVRPDRWTAPDRARVVVPDRRPGETAYVLAERGADTVYAGVGRWRDAEGWAFPALDFETWRALSGSRSASRTLDERWEARARELAAGWVEGGPRWAEARGRRCRVVGQAVRGGLRIDGGRV